MNILFSTDSFDPAAGGPSRSVPQLAKALGDLGVRVGLWAPDGSATSSMLALEVDQAAHLQGSAANMLREFGKVDILHDNGLWRLHHSRLNRLSRARGIPRVVSTRGMLEPWAFQFKGLKKKIAWWAYQKKDLQQANVIHATSAEEASNLRLLGLESTIEVISNGVELPDLSKARPDLSEDKQRICLFLSRIHPKKGLPLFLRAWAQVRPKNWRLVIAGPDEAGHLDFLKTLVKELSLNSCVEFVGPLEGERKTQAFLRSALFVLPTHSENFGIVVAEALAYECPVITTQGAPWGVVTEERCGWWVPVSVDALAAAIREATNLDPVVRGEMGRRGRALIERDYTWNKLAHKFLEVYSGMLR